MPKSLIITEAVETMIATIHKKHPKWKASEVQNEASFLIRKNNPNIPSGWPGLSAVQKVLAKIRRKDKEIPEDPLHKPWSMGTLNDLWIPPDAIPFVLDVWKLLEEKAYKFRNLKPGFDFPLTIREAKWVSRLCRVIPNDIEKLSLTAAIYAESEELSERLGHPFFDSTELDYDLKKPNRPLPHKLIAIAELVRSQVEQSRDVKQGKTEEAN